MTTMNATQPPATAGGPYVLAPAVLADIRLQADQLLSTVNMQMACNASEIKAAQARILGLTQRLTGLNASRVFLLSAHLNANSKRNAIYALTATLGAA